MNLVSEKTVRDALRPHRPLPDAFRRAVEEKIARREASVVAAAPLRQAAGLLPIGMLEPTVLGGSAAAVGKKLGAASAGAVLALPVVSLAMLALAFGTAFRSVTRLRTGDAARDEAVRAATADWWRAHAVHAIVALAVLSVLAVVAPAEALLAVLLVSMLTLAALMRRLSHAGVATRRTVGGLASSMLWALFVLMLVFDDFAVGLRTVHVDDHWVALVVLAGALGCHYAALWSPGWSALRKRLTVAIPSLGLGIVAAGLHVLAEPPSEARAAVFVGEFDRPLRASPDWMRLGAVGEWLTSRGVAFDAAPAQRAVDAALAARDPREPVFAGELDPYALWGAARVGAVSDPVWEAVAADDGTRAALDHATLAAVAPRALETRVRAVLASEGLSESERDRIAAAVLAGWPGEDHPDVLRDLARRVDLLDLLERPIDVEARRAEVHRVLERLWLGRVEARPYPAPFVASDDALARHADRLLHRRLDDFHYVEPTCDAVALLLRFGAPDGIDADRVRAFLEHAATPSVVEVLAPRSVTILATQPYRFRATAALRRLESAPNVRLPGLTPARLAGMLFGERILLGTLLLVTLSIAAIRSQARSCARTSPARSSKTCPAPPSEPEDHTGR